MPLDVAGFAFGLAIIIVCFLAFGAIPFTRRFSLYLDGTKS
jgi:hypothetical protein